MSNASRAERGTVEHWTRDGAIHGSWSGWRNLSAPLALKPGTLQSVVSSVHFSPRAALCELASHLSMTALAISNARQSPGSGVRGTETTITGVLAWLAFEQARRTPGGIPVRLIELDIPTESVTGADLEVWFCVGGEGFAWRVQAKRMDAPRVLTPARYRDVDHLVGRKRQVDLLISGCRKTRGILPVYWLYGHRTESCPNKHCSSTDPCHPTDQMEQAILVAPADQMSAALDEPQKAKGKVEYQSIISASKSLHALWCSWGAVGDEWSEIASALNNFSVSMLDDAAPNVYRRGRVDLPDYVASVRQRTDVRESVRLDAGDDLAPPVNHVIVLG